ncbi:uncharacterized protein LOC100902288 [Galendromus occidentalis]|uniref:Uncharacterized protein LOC100902288 n=1 Tax=Galendromus occidentalis TaxID=34638 RepID=A0AAJ6QYW3_9ACAR|nr:uncharacterized protein LOC100902288 [Galendromus occidentalis]
MASGEDNVPTSKCVLVGDEGPRNQFDRRKYISISLLGSNQVRMIRLGENSTLSLRSLQNAWPGASLLIFFVDNIDAEVVVDRDGDVFLPPDGGWTERIYYATTYDPEEPIGGSGEPSDRNSKELFVKYTALGGICGLGLLAVTLIAVNLLSEIPDVDLGENLTSGSVGRSFQHHHIRFPKT